MSMTPADRLTRTTYPDGTTDQYTYDKLDLASIQDRQGRRGTTLMTQTVALSPSPTRSAM